MYCLYNYSRMKHKIIILVAFIALGFLAGVYFSFIKPRIISKPEDQNKIIVYKNRKLLLLYNRGTVFAYKIATGKNNGDKQSVGDCRTPLGKFKVVSVEKSTTWTYDFGDGKGLVKGAYGPWFIRLQGLEPSNKMWEGIAIHGTHLPSSIGKNDTHGCIRMRNNELTELYKVVTTNYSVEILD